MAPVIAQKPTKIFPKTEETGSEAPDAKKAPLKLKQKEEDPNKWRRPTQIFLNADDPSVENILKSNKAPLRIYPETEESIVFWCSYCKQKYSLPHNLSGKKSFCNNCKNDLFIPSISQTKPQFKESIIFACKHCKHKLWKLPKLIGEKIFCHDCGNENIVPEKSEKSLLQKITPVKLQNALIASEQTKMNMVVVGQPPEDKKKAEPLPKDEPEKPKKKKFKIVYNTDPIDEKEKERKRDLPTVDDYIGPQIIITEETPNIHKIKGYFQKKAEKYFIFAIFVLLIDYIIKNYGNGQRPSKAFTLFCVFTVSAIILLIAWNYVMYVPPSKTNKCRYNVTCTKKTCELNKVRRFENVAKGKCSKCSSKVGLAYRCKACKKSFAYNEEAVKSKIKAKIQKEAERLRKWYGKKAKEKIKERSTLFNNRVIKKCPHCNSEDVHYVTVKQAEKEADQVEMEKEFLKTQKDAAAKKNGKKKKKKKKKK